jgi:hypothetical protein
LFFLPGALVPAFQQVKHGVSKVRNWRQFEKQKASRAQASGQKEDVRGRRVFCHDPKTQELPSIL